MSFLLSSMKPKKEWGIASLLLCTKAPGNKLPHGNGLVETIGVAICVACCPIADFGNYNAIV